MNNNVYSFCPQGLAAEVAFGIPTVSCKIGQYSVNDWLSRDFTYKEPLLTPWLMPEARYMIWGPTGCGKSALMLAMAFAVATGKALGKWSAPKPAKVLYIDGEMSRRDLQMRLREFLGAFGDPGNRLRVFSTADVQNICPLDEPEQIRMLGMYIDSLRPDLIILDNIQCLVSRSIKEGDAYDNLQPVMLDIRNRGICSVWGHHAGFNSDHAYGDSRFAWQMSGTLKVTRVTQNLNEEEQGELKVRISVDKAFRELRNEDVVRIPQHLIFRGGVIEAPLWSNEKLTGVAALLDKIITEQVNAGFCSGRVSALRKAFSEKRSAEDRNKSQDTLRTEFGRALKKLQKLGYITLSGPNNDLSWEISG